jgi:hypothetical protein
MTDYTKPWAQASVGTIDDTTEAEQFFRHFTGFGADNNNRGVMRGVSDELEVQQSAVPAQSVLVKAGAALIYGRMCVFAETTVTIAANASGNARIDVIVAQWDKNDLPNPISIAVEQGTPAASPVPNSMQQSATIWQIPLAYVAVANGFATITTSNITDGRLWSNTPDAIFLEVTNKSGGELNDGDVVIWYDSANTSVTTTVSLTDAFNIAGVVEGKIANNAVGRICVRGITKVLCAESVVVGDLVGTGTTAKQALKGNPAPFARVLVANGGTAARAYCYVDVPIKRKSPACRVYRASNQVLGGAGAILFTDEFYDNNAMHSTVSNTSRVTANVPGIYHFTANIRTSVSGIICSLVHSSAGTIDIRETTGTNNTALLSASYQMQAGEYVEIQIGSAATVTANNFYSPMLTAEWISAE